jgi:hypothetical protein
VNDRNYTSWEVFDNINFNKIKIDINPTSCKLFSNDVFTINENKVNILHSSIRSSGDIPGVLIISGNKTYGRENNSNKGKKNGKLFYKCIPDDMRLPAFVIPYEIKSLGFSKIQKNLYVTFTFNEWNDKHPCGKLSKVIGSVDELDNFYEYQLYCKSLNASIQKFQKDTAKSLEKHSHEVFIESIKQKYPNIEDRTDQQIWNIITIDPPKSQDFDDAFSIIDMGGNVQKLSIYISNVTIWMDILNLWDSFSRRISTIYLPDKKRPMLPTILSDCLCSLQENVTRIAFVMDIFIDTQTNNILEIKYSNCFIKVHKNYCYEEDNLHKNETYTDILKTTRLLSKKFKYINNVKNSHDVVCYLMIFMNFYCANELMKYKCGIFRSTIMNKEVIINNETLPEDVVNFIKIWNSSSGQYINGSEITSETNIRHDLLNMDAYIHITSPIRRLVDLLNMIKLQQMLGIIPLSNHVDSFYNKWINDLDYINVTMRSIRKVQCDCTLLDLCCNSPNIMEKIYDGYIFDKIPRNDGLYQYIAFLPELKLSSRITLRENLENYEKKQFNLFLFNDEEKFKRKIRLQIL